MQKVRCYECGKQYDYDEDGFCPEGVPAVDEGDLNQPPRSTAIGADGSVVRADGLNERNHKNSFVHEELHEENRQRKTIGLSKGVRRAETKVPQTGNGTTARKSRSSTRKSSLGGVIFWIIFAIFALNILSNIFYLF